MAVERAIKYPETIPGELIEFPSVVREPSLPLPLETQHLDLYDASREGTESLPQLAKSVLIFMIRQEEKLMGGKKSLRDKACVSLSAKERATEKFLEFVAENEAMSKLDTTFLAEITKKSPQSIQEFLKERLIKSA
jgi:hypothetical protein